MMLIFACERCLNVPPKFGCYNFAKVEEMFSDRLAVVFPQLLNKF